MYKVTATGLMMLFLSGNPAMAQPDPLTSEVPVIMYLVGSNSGVPDPLNAVSLSNDLIPFFVRVRTSTGSPVPFVPVDLLIPIENYHIHCVGSFEGYTLSSSGEYWKVSTVANAVGEVELRVRGWANYPNTCGITPPFGSAPGSAKVIAGGVDLTAHYFGGGVHLATPDLDGGGVGANDLSHWLVQFGCGAYNSTHDYDRSGSISANDLSWWLDLYGGGRSATQSCP